MQRKKAVDARLVSAFLTVRSLSLDVQHLAEDAGAKIADATRTAIGVLAPSATFQPLDFGVIDATLIHSEDGVGFREVDVTRKFRAAWARKMFSGAAVLDMDRILQGTLAGAGSSREVAFVAVRYSTSEETSAKVVLPARGATRYPPAKHNRAYSEPREATVWAPTCGSCNESRNVADEFYMLFCRGGGHDWANADGPEVLRCARYLSLRSCLPPELLADAHLTVHWATHKDQVSCARFLAKEPAGGPSPPEPSRTSDSPLMQE